MLQAIRSEFAQLPGKAMAKDYNRIARRLYRQMPRDPDEFVALCDNLMASKEPGTFWLVNLWIKRNGRVYELKYFNLYEKWLYEYADCWGRCDALCYRVLNPMVEKFPQLFTYLLKWTASPKTYVRRAAAVALLQSTYTFIVNADFAKVRAICERLKNDKELHVQKGVGWLLKYTYLTYPEETVQYLRDNVQTLSRTTFRYALEKMPPGLRRELMNL